MQTKTRQQLKKLLFEISPKEKREEIIFKESDTLAKDIENLAQALSVLDKSRQRDSDALMAMVRDHIAGVRNEMAETFEKHRLELSQRFEGVFSKYGEYEKAVDGKNSHLSKELRNEIKKEVKELSKEIGRVNDLIPKMWGGSSRTLYLNGNTISPQNLYSDVNLIPGNGIVISAVNNPTTLRVDVTISSTGGGGLDSEVPGGDIDGVNTEFTVLNTPVMFFWNGQFQNPNVPDYTYASGIITMTTPPSPGDNLLSFF